MRNDAVVTRQVDGGVHNSFYIDFYGSFSLWRIYTFYRSFAAMLSRILKRHVQHELLSPKLLWGAAIVLSLFVVPLWLISFAMIGVL